MSTHKQIKLHNSELCKIQVDTVLAQTGSVLLNQLLSKEFRDNLSVKDCEKLIDIAVDNLINSMFFNNTTIEYIRNMSSYKSFIVNGDKRTITEV